jgi:hypothetical protein
MQELAAGLRSLQNAPLGFVCRVGSVTLYVTNDPADVLSQGRVSMPPDAWSVLASKVIEVTAGWEDSPFDFSECGFLAPPPTPDIGVELVGEPERD